MEPTAPEDEPARDTVGHADWRSLSHLRDRVTAAVREIERLRAENAALAKRLIDLESGTTDGPSFTFGEGEDPEVLRSRVQGFIDVIDGLLAGGDGASTSEPNEAA